MTEEVAILSLKICVGRKLCWLNSRWVVLEVAGVRKKDWFLPKEKLLTIEKDISWAQQLLNIQVKIPEEPRHIPKRNILFSWGAEPAVPFFIPMVWLRAHSMSSHSMTPVATPSLPFVLIKDYHYQNMEYRYNIYGLFSIYSK